MCVLDQVARIFRLLENLNRERAAEIVGVNGRMGNLKMVGYYAIRAERERAGAGWPPRTLNCTKMRRVMSPILK